jgi:hypothetical protein
MAALSGSFVLRNASFKFNGVEYAHHATKVRIVPDTPIQTLRTLDPAGAVTDVDSATYTLEIAGVQDALAQDINDAAGTVVEVIYQPKKGSGTKIYTFDVVAIATPIGGEQGAFLTFDITLPIQGDITTTTAP